ncbi:aminoglycoside phosphotransferase [Frankia sp. CcI49]|uniref:phosphotransferase n=1 Tax=unclassified Frankia TaxID=2632575 RepID=UPI0006CA37F6|nr:MULTISPECIES: phosphotransferase [unclassified Frankia]KPM52269.1 aminoglycoside phosphotransferase [Frankia sp. R43]ONH52431.1 aminoglycoside phosphotransferase [Frankia sp. CcI49]
MPDVRVPERLDEVLSPEWLTAALGRRFPGIEVTAVTRGPTVSRISTNVRFAITCAGGVPDGLSPDLCVKGYFSERTLPARHAGIPETLFYRDLAERTGVRTLRGVYAEVDRATGANILITQDVISDGGAFLDGRHPYTPDQAAESLEQLARLHTATWGDPRLADAGWLSSRMGPRSDEGWRGKIEANYTSDTGAGVPEQVRDVGRIMAAYGALAAVVADTTPWTIVHGDPHVGNIFLDGAGRPSLLDWQLVQRAPWYLDTGYHIASALTVADRRRHEDDLLRHYLDVLGAGLRTTGVEPPSWDEAQLGVRRSVLHGCYLWSITSMVDPAVTRVLLERLGTAVADLDSLTSVGS